MKLSTKIILPIILISALLISLSGCIIPTVTPSPGETTTGGTIIGTFETPEACCMSNRDHTEGWVPLVNATVSVIDSKGVAHTTKTDSDGKYWLTDVAPGIYYVVTACCECEDREGVYKDVVEEELKEGDTYDAGIADCESTALGLMVDYLLSGDVFVEEDCNCYCNCFDEESQIYALLVTTGVKLRVAAVNLLNPATKPLDKIRANADFQGFVVELCDLLEACCVEPGVAPPTGGTPTTVPTVSISLTKEVVDADCYTPGEKLVYTLTVKNTGSVALTDVTLNDSLLGLTNFSIPDLAVGDSWTNGYDYDVPEEQTGTLTNSAVVSGTYGTKTVSATASVSLEACTTPELGKIIVKKVVTGEGDPQDPDKVFSFTITGPEAFSEGFDLQAGDTKEYPNIPIGSYMITELPAGTGWITTVSGGTNNNPCTVNLGADDDITVTFTNEYCPCAENVPPVITDVMLNCDSIFGSNEVHLAIGTLYEVCVFATDDDGILPPPLAYSFTVNGDEYPLLPEGTNCFSGTPLCEDVGTYTVSVSVFDGCDTTTWGPITFIVDCDPPCCLPQFVDFNTHGTGDWESKTSYFPNVELRGIGNNPNGYNIWNGDGWTGWCADSEHYINQSYHDSVNDWYNHRGVVCSIDPTIVAGDYIIPWLYDEIVNWYDGSIEWDKINWIINKRTPDDKLGDVQEAIWHYTNGFVTSRPRSSELIADANDNGGGFIPAVGQKYAVILDANLRCYIIQRIFIEAIRTCCCEAWH